MRRGFCLVLVAVIAAVPAAQARRLRAKPVPDVSYAGQTEQGVGAYVRLLPHHLGVSAAFTYTTSCTAGDGSIIWTGVAKAALKGGHFHYARKEDANGPQITLDGKVSPAFVTGTWHVHFSTRDQLGTVRDTCDSGVVHWTLPRDGAGGQVAKGYPIVLRLATTKVESLELVTQVRCKSGNTYVIPSFYDNFPIAKDGTFGQKFTDSGVPAKGQKSALTIEVHGTVKGGKAKGTWHLAAVFSDADSGKQVDTCDSGPLTWTATA
jgi:hypothetical protein